MNITPSARTKGKGVWDIRNEWPPVDEIIRRLRNPRGGGSPRRIPCPAHGGEHNNLAISPGRDGPPVVFCHSHGCDTETILDGLRKALGMPAFDPKAPRDDRPRPKPKPEPRHQELNKSFAIAEAWWSMGIPVTPASPAGKYLASRGISVFKWPRNNVGGGKTRPFQTVRRISAASGRNHFRGIPPSASELVLYRTEDFGDALRFIGVVVEAVTAAGRRCAPTPRWEMKRRTFGNLRRGLFRAGGPGGDMSAPLVVAEGAVDALVIAARLTAGHVIGIPGTSGFAAFGEHLARNPEGRRVIVETDGDAPGREAADRLCKPLFRSGRPFRVIDRGEGRDPADDYAAHAGIDYAEEGF